MADLRTDPGREGTRLITALEKCWTAIQKHHPDVPPVLFITGTGISRRQTEKPRTSTDAPRRHYPTRGHHWADRWAVAEREQRLAELFVAGETIKDGGEEILKTELHEAAHSLAHVRKIQDTSKGDPRWHRKEFAALAREVGLEPLRRSEKPLGFSNCTLTDATRRRYASVIRQLDAAALPGLGDDRDAAVEEPPVAPEPPARRTASGSRSAVPACPSRGRSPSRRRSWRRGRSSADCAANRSPSRARRRARSSSPEPTPAPKRNPTPSPPSSPSLSPDPAPPRPSSPRIPPWTWGTNPRGPAALARLTAARVVVHFSMHMGRSSAPAREVRGGIGRRRQTLVVTVEARPPVGGRASCRLWRAYWAREAPSRLLF